MPHSQSIGDEHELKLKALLNAWGIPFERKKKIRTAHNAHLTLDFWIPSAAGRPQVVLECKTFGVAAKSVADSRRRKTQEALWLLLQVRRYCEETRDARILIVTGQEAFLSEHLKLLRSELQPDVHVVSINDTEHLHALLEVRSEGTSQPDGEARCPACGSALQIQPGANEIGETTGSATKIAGVSVTFVKRP